MTPHKDESKLPLEDQIKLVRDKLDDLSWKLTGIDIKHQSQENTLKIVKVDLKDIHNEIKELKKGQDKQDEFFKRWKSELFTKIDKGFAKPIRDLQQETGALEFRLEEHQQDIDKLKTSVLQPI